MKHIHCDVIKAWADGAEIQYYSGGIWTSVGTPTWLPTVKYRVKPSTIKYRVGAIRIGNEILPVIVSKEETAVKQASSESFVKWVTDWVEAEVND